MEEQTNISPQYKKGFNHAYALSKDDPDLIKGVNLPENLSGEYTQGFNDGAKEFEREKRQEQVRNQMNKGKAQDREQ